MQVTPSPALIEALSQLSQRVEPRAAQTTPRARPAEEGAAADGSARPAPPQAHLGRFVDITV